jgi:hypothetical protein
MDPDSDVTNLNAIAFSERDAELPQVINIQVTDSKEKNSSLKANGPLAFQGTRRLLWKPKFHYRVPNSPPLVPILTRLNPVHIHISLISILILFHPRLCACSFLFGSSD